MTFEERLEKLNTQQRRAVETTEGPVMVIAGPGTGKTEILSLRIGHIIKSTDTPPGGILCLTYTDAAATEMRHRLISYIGPEAYKIQVNTFHGFCNLVIQENPEIFQQARELEPISDIDRFTLLQELIDHFGPDHPLKRFKGNIYNEWKKLSDLFTTMKKEDWQPEDMYARIDEYIERMRTDTKYVYQVTRKGQFEKGQQKPDFKTKVLDRMATLKAAIGEYATYNKMLADRGQYDFDDMLLWVEAAFQHHPDLLANYQERFLYFLVDEFQDTNGIQIHILQKLIDHEFLERPNVFVVGDDDQAIYRFQGANIENLIAFYERYQPEVIFLEDNYRSSQRIIDTSRKVMKPVEVSVMRQIFNLDKKLHAAGKFAQHPAQVKIMAMPNLTYENAEIFERLRMWHSDQHTGDIAVLYSKHESGKEIAQALKGAQIPFHTTRTIDVLKQPFILHLLDIATCIHHLASGADNDDGLLYRVLHLRYLHPPVSDLQRLIIAYSAFDYRERGTLFGWMTDTSRLDTIGFNNRDDIDRISQLLATSITEYHNRSLLSFLEWIVHAFGMMKWLLEEKDQFTLLYALKTFYKFVDKQSMGKRQFTVPDILHLCEMMDTYKLSLPIEELGPPAQGIHLSSLHGAKGLEYDTVIIKNLTENEWEKRRKNYGQSFSYPDNLVREKSLSDLESDIDPEDSDRRRLLYVGMTRAKQDLLLTYAMAREDGKALTPSLYLSELQKEQPDIETEIIKINEAKQAAYLAAMMSGEQKAFLQKDDSEIAERVRNFVLNVSALNTYLECPVRFFYEKILVVPATETPALIFGSAMHHGLQMYFRRRFSEKDTTTSKEYLQDAFKWYMDKYRHRLTEKARTDLIVYGKKMLSEFYDQYHSSWSDVIDYKLEHRIQDVHFDGIPVKGFIDRIDHVGNEWHVIDYKTGNADNIGNKLKGPDEKDPKGGHYWRQMVFYDLLLRQDPRIRQGVSKASVQALEPNKDDKLIERSISITDEDRETLMEQIRDTYSKIQRMEFETGCGECEWCRMHDLTPPLPSEDYEADPR